MNFLKDFFICYNIISEDNSNKLSDTVWKYAPLVENEYAEDHITKFISSLLNKLPKEEQFLKLFQSIGWSNHHGFYNDEHKKRQVQAVLELIESIKLGHALTEPFTIEHVLPDSQAPENALVGNLLPLERELNDKCKDKTLRDKIVYYKKSQFKTAREFAERYENQSLLYLCEFINNNIYNTKSLTSVNPSRKSWPMNETLGITHSRQHQTFQTCKPS